MIILYIKIKSLYYRAIQPLDHVTQVRPRDNLKNLYFHYQKTVGQ